MNFFVYSTYCLIFDKIPPTRSKVGMFESSRKCSLCNSEESFLYSILLTRSKLSIINLLYRWKNVWLIQVTAVTRNLLNKRITNAKKSQDLFLAMRAFEHSEYTFCKSPRSNHSSISICMIYMFCREEISIIWRTSLFFIYSHIF